MPTAPLELRPPQSHNFPSSWTLILPSVTIGNTPQLAIDLLLTSLPVTHIAHVRAPSLLPFVSPAPVVPSHKPSILTALELYQIAPTTYILQQRSPAATGRTSEFASSLIEWATSNGCSCIIVFASSNAAGLQRREQFSKWQSMFRFAASTKGLTGDFISRLKKMQINVIETASDDPKGWEEKLVDVIERDLGKEDAKVPAFVATGRKGAFIRGILQEAERKDLDVGVLVQFVHEGDNGDDARMFATVGGLGSACIEGEMAELHARWKVPRAWLDIGEAPVGMY